MAKRVISFCILFMLGLMGPTVLFIPALVVYVFFYTSMEVLLIAVCVDAYFGYGASMPYLYTLSTAALLLVVHVSRPYLSVYNR